MLEDIKKIGGINNSDFDMIILNYISSAKRDLLMAGIIEDKITENDPLIYSAIISYVLGLTDVANSELYQNAYMIQKDQLRHFREYIGD